MHVQTKTVYNLSKHLLNTYFSSGAISVVKILRVLRVLRPLRYFSR